MTEEPAAPTLQALTERLAIFPLSGALLLPGGQLPLHIFEPRYRSMVRDALAEERLIGMIQPRRPEAIRAEEKEATGAVAAEPPLYMVGCCGRMTAFRETEDGRFFIVLTGLLRFRVARELEGQKGYRRVAPNFAPFLADLKGSQGVIDRPRVLRCVKRYFEARQLQADWLAIEATGDDQLVTSLAMSCPFDVAEKQMLLEAPSLEARGQTLIAILELAAVDKGDHAVKH